MKIRVCDFCGERIDFYALHIGAKFNKDIIIKAPGFGKFEVCHECAEKIKEICRENAKKGK